MRSRFGLEYLRSSFWFLPVVGLLAGVVLGLGTTSIDALIGVRLPLFEDTDAESARSLLETIATATLSVAGVTFSVTVVALQLASSQLNPRILRTFQTDRMSQLTLAAFLGSFTLSVATLIRLPTTGRASDLAVAVAVIAVIAALILFAAFIHHIVVSLQASTLIHRVALEGDRALEYLWPTGTGHDPQEPVRARLDAEHRMSAGSPAEVRAPRGGYLVAVDGPALVRTAQRHDGLIAQSALLGDFVVRGTTIAWVWHPAGAPDDLEAVVDAVGGCFSYADERNPVQDVAFPVRQLADVALRGLSPSLNDPTTAEDALGSLAQLLITFAHTDHPSALRTDDDGTPRVLARVPVLDDLVRLGFDQVRVAAAPHPVVAARILWLLGEIRRTAVEQGCGVAELDRQAELLREGVHGEVPTQADEALVDGSEEEAGDQHRPFPEVPGPGGMRRAGR
jgi:uncharacterized membrane protein